MLPEVRLTAVIRPLVSEFIAAAAVNWSSQGKGGCGCRYSVNVSRSRGVASTRRRRITTMCVGGCGFMWRLSAVKFERACRPNHLLHCNYKLDDSVRLLTTCYWNHCCGTRPVYFHRNRKLLLNQICPVLFNEWLSYNKDLINLRFFQVWTEWRSSFPSDTPTVVSLSNLVYKSRVITFMACKHLQLLLAMYYSLV